jgi:hypothetical protein
LIPENRNAKGEDVGKFVAEMMKLAKRPEMRPFLTETEVRRQEAERKRDEEAEEKRKEEWMIESSRRYEIISKWFHLHMSELAPEAWKTYQAEAEADHHKALRNLRKAGWKLHARFVKVAPPGYEPVAATNCAILHRSVIQKIERLIWEEPKPIKSKIITEPQ